MNKDLTPEEVEALSKAMGNTPAHSPEDVAGPRITRAQFLPLEELSEATDLPKKDLEKVYDVKVEVEVVLGTTRVPLDEVLSLHPGSVVELNKLAGEPVELYANQKLVAKAEIVVIEENFGVKILEIVGDAQKLRAVQ